MDAEQIKKAKDLFYKMEEKADGIFCQLNEIEIILEDEISELSELDLKSGDWEPEHCSKVYNRLKADGLDPLNLMYLFKTAIDEGDIQINLEVGEQGEGDVPMEVLISELSEVTLWPKTSEIATSWDKIKEVLQTMIDVGSSSVKIKFLSK